VWDYRAIGARRKTKGRLHTCETNAKHACTTCTVRTGHALQSVLASMGGPADRDAVGVGEWQTSKSHKKAPTTSLAGCSSWRLWRGRPVCGSPVDRACAQCLHALVVVFKPFVIWRSRAH
jgi:hypothetical protein